jgi:hypothetical protein
MVAVCKLSPLGSRLGPPLGESLLQDWLGLADRATVWNPPRQLLYARRYDPSEFAAAPRERDERARGARRATE